MRHLPWRGTLVAMAASVAVSSAAQASPADAVTWLLTPISGSTHHEISASIAWHGRLMVLAWAFLMPLAAVIARYFKVTPRQKWPARLDNPFWFISHRRIGISVVVVATLALLLAFIGRGGVVPTSLHGWVGLLVVVFAWLQIVNGALRGTHGGPVDPFTRKRKPPEQWPGDHFSMTRRRVTFEYFHKAVGYALIVLCIIAILAGLHEADAPRWMWLAIVAWWIVMAIALVILQRRVGCIDTYQAIWGLDRSLPGYRRAPIGIGITRFDETTAGRAPWQRGTSQ